MMDHDESEPDIFAGITYPDDNDSGSQYEASSASEHEHEVIAHSEPGPAKAQHGEVTASIRHPIIRNQQQDDAGPEAHETVDTASHSEVDDQILEEACAWAATFKPPAPEDIRNPSRRPSRKRRVGKAPNLVRSKRLQPYYDNRYRDLLNAEIYAAAYGNVPDNGLEAGQIGASIWTSEEKDLLFDSLARLGRDNVQGIAAQLAMKSEPEVHEYLLLLQTDVKERKKKGARNLSIADVAAAVEISEECCLVLGRAGDALAIRQELAEEKIEQSKWSDIWLINEKTSLLIEQRRREKGGEDALEASLPAGNLFITRNWLELSRRLFMNAGPGREEDNWQTIAEVGESPAVRATAFEDFHSLAVNMLKKLLSTTMYCTTSRLRAGDYHYIKISEVTADDVEAAIKILGLKSGNSQFWLDCAKRNNLEVIDDGEPVEEGESVSLTVDSFQQELRHPTLFWSRSRSISRHERRTRPSGTSTQLEPAYSSPSDLDTEDPEHYDSEDSSSSQLESSTNREVSGPDSPMSPKHTLVQDREAAEDAEEGYLERTDTQASQMEEAKLWVMISQDPPFDIATPSEDPKRPMAIRADVEDGRSWRDHLEYRGLWESTPTPIPGLAFLRNRQRRSRRAKVRAKGTFPYARGTFTHVSTALWLESQAGDEVHNSQRLEKGDSLDGEEYDEPHGMEPSHACSQGGVAEDTKSSLRR